MMQDDLDAYVMASEDTKSQLEEIKTENEKLKEEVITAHNEVGRNNHSLSSHII